MFSADDSKQKKSRRVEETATRSSAREPVRNLEPGIPKRRSNLNLLTIPLHAPVQDSTPVTQTVDSAEAKPDYQGMSYPEKLNAAIQMVPELLVGDAKALLDDFPAFIAQMVVVGGIFAGLQATPAGPFIDLALFAIMGVEATTKLLGFLYKCHTAQNEKDLREAAEDLKVFIEIVGLAAATKLLQMAGRALKNLSGEAKAARGQEAIPSGTQGAGSQRKGGISRNEPDVAQNPSSRVNERTASSEARNPSSLERRVSESNKGYRSTPEIKKQFREFFGKTRYSKYAKEVEALKLKYPELKDIPTEDLVAVRGYTSNDYSMLNKALRSGDPAELERLHAYIKTAESGLSQLPSHQGAVFRGTNLSSEAALKYKPGQPVTEEFFFSTSAERSSAFPGNTKYYVNSANGKRVEFLSEFPHEREVLFPPGTKFDVISVQVNPSTGQREIFMNEIPARK
jgi:hypothetical protein